MTEKRKQEIITKLEVIYGEFEKTEHEPELTVFGLLSRYNSTHENNELIHGDWVVENCPSPLKDLPI